MPPLGGMQNLARMRFLYDSILRFAERTSDVALEIGVCEAGSLVFLVKACLRKGITHIYGMDLFTGTPSWHQKFDTYEIAEERLRRYKLHRSTTLVRSHSAEYTWSKAIDVLHLDADHEYRAVITDIRKYSPFLVEGGLMILDDYDACHPGVRRAVHELLLEDEYEIVAINYEGLEWGSVCLRKRSKFLEHPERYVTLFDRLLGRYGRRSIDEGNLRRTKRPRFCSLNEAIRSESLTSSDTRKPISCSFCRR